MSFPVHVLAGTWAGLAMAFYGPGWPWAVHCPGKAVYGLVCFRHWLTWVRHRVCLGCPWDCLVWSGHEMTWPCAGLDMDLTGHGLGWTWTLLVMT
jgi:hypothetical protein